MLGNKLTIFLFVFPALALFTVFMIYPLLPTLYRSFYSYNGIRALEFVGLRNYAEMLGDPVFWRANANTLKIVAVQYAVGFPLSLLFALLLYQKTGRRLGRFFKTASFLPSILSVTVICLMWKMIFQPEWGVIDQLLTALWLESWIRTWLINSSTALWTITFAYLWQFVGFNMLLLYAGMKSIPEPYIEAARLEGAGFAQISYSIVVPLIREMTKFVFILMTAGCLGMFAHVQLLTNGGPGDLTRTLVFQLYYKAFSVQNFGGAYAITVFYALEGLLLFAIVNRLVARERLEYV